MSNPWVKYIDRSYSSIKTSILSGLTSAVSELTDHSPSNLLIVIADMFAGVAEMINYYIDITARELFLPTARRLSSMINLAELAGYSGKARTGAHTSLTFTAYDAGNNIIPAPTAFTIPTGIELTDAKGNTWITQHEQVFREGYSAVEISATQYSIVTGVTLGTSDGSVDQTFPLPLAYKNGSLSAVIAAQAWELVETFGFSSATDRHFLVKLTSSGIMNMIFGDGVNGAIPANLADIVVSYHSTEGPAGNTSKNTITTIVTSITSPGVDHLEVTNNNDGFGGRDIEGLEELRRAIPIALRTLNRAVTRKDYEDIAILDADIRAARVEWDCGARVILYLVSHGGGNPPQAILNRANAFVLARSMMTINLTTLPSGETHIKGSISIVGKFRALATTINTKAIAALQDLYNPFSSKINQNVRTSDIIAAIDNIPEVDYLTLDTIYAQPYLRPSNPAAPLLYSIEVKSTSTVKTTWVISYDPAADAVEPFHIFKGGTFLVKMAESTTENNVGGLINITLGAKPGSAVQDDEWAFVVYPYGQDINLDDMSIPVIGPSDFTISIQQSYIDL